MLYFTEIEATLIMFGLLLFLGWELVKTYRPRIANVIRKKIRKCFKVLLFVLALPFCIAVLSSRYIKKYLRTI